MPHQYYGGAWKCKLNIANEMKAGEARRITPETFGKRVAKQIRKSSCPKNRKITHIADEFDILDSDSSWENVDELLTELFDWGDDERVWIEQIERRKK